MYLVWFWSREDDDRGTTARVAPPPLSELVSPYSAILSRKPSTSSRMLAEKNLGNSVDEGVRDRGGMCLKAFLQVGIETEVHTKHSLVTERLIT